MDKNYLVVGEDGTHHQIQQLIKTLTEQTRQLKKEAPRRTNTESTEKYLQKEIDKLYGKGAFKVKRINNYNYEITIDNKPKVKQIMMEMNIK